ncbi:MAG: XRE family transcriptional regulator [Clostridiales bacterium]|nr:XRE family transcriptional regulator [Clostridiales bacterium]
MIFELREYDNILLKFSLQRAKLGEIVYHIEYVNDELKYLLPIGMTPDSEGLVRWLSSRVIPKNREFVDQILSRSGLSHNDTIGIIQLSKGLSLNDSYWIVEEGFRGKFASYNLYENSFSRTLALIAYTGYGSTTHNGFTSSPEYTTNGMLRKCWRRINKKIYLSKGGTSGAANAGKEPYSEFYAAQIAERMGLKHVNYGLSKWKDIVCSTCELFTDINTSYVPIHKFLPNCTLTKAVKYLKSLGDSYYDEFADMMIFDALVCNTDRHFGNFGLLVDNSTNKPIALAPIFDNGLSLFNYAMEDDLREIEKYAKTRTPAFEGVSYDALVQEFLSDRQRVELRKLINFKFKKHPKYNLPNDRLKIIEAFIQTRVNEMLDMKK